MRLLAGQVHPSGLSLSLASGPGTLVSLPRVRLESDDTWCGSSPGEQRASALNAARIRVAELALVLAFPSTRLGQLHSSTIVCVLPSFSSTGFCSPGTAPVSSCYNALDAADAVLVADLASRRLASPRPSTTDTPAEP